MSTPSSNIRDNHKRGSAGGFLQQHIAPGSVLSAVSAYFTVPAYVALRPQLDSIVSMRFLFGEPAFLDSLDSEHVHSKRFTLKGDSLALDKQTLQ